MEEERRSMKRKKGGSGVLVAGNLEVAGDLIVENLRIRGNLLVEGNISGQLVTGRGEADYAEWFAILESDQGNIRAGDVVQLRSPDQKITKDTTGNGPHLVVSTSPSVAAGVPSESESGALVGFLGQVPVNVRGPVSCGDFLYPSGLNDGFAVSRHPFEKDVSRTEPLGTAMTSCGEGEHKVIAFVRWKHDLSYSVWKNLNDNFFTSVDRMWGITALSFGILATHGVYISYRPNLKYEHFLWWGDFAFSIWACLHYPTYREFAIRDIWVYLALFVMGYPYYLWRLKTILSTPPEQVGEAFTLVDIVMTACLVIYQGFELKLAWGLREAFLKVQPYDNKAPMCEIIEDEYGSIKLPFATRDPRSKNPM